MTECSDPLCVYRSQQLDRALVEMLQLRLEVADGPRARVKELEATVCTLNARVAKQNAEIETLRKQAGR